MGYAVLARQEHDGQVPIDDAMPGVEVRVHHSAVVEVHFANVVVDHVDVAVGAHDVLVHRHDLRLVEEVHG